MPRIRKSSRKPDYFSFLTNRDTDPLTNFTLVEKMVEINRNRKKLSAAMIAEVLKGRKVGQAWMARCPAHEDKTPSLSIRQVDEGRVLVHCFAGCTQSEVIASLRSIGLWFQSDHSPYKSATARRFIDQHNFCITDSDRTKFALSLWESSSPAEHTPVEIYLKSRGLRLPSTSALRFHPRLRHPSGNVWPAMIGLVTMGIDEVPTGIHRTYLALDGKAKAAATPQKMMLGPCRGGAVRLAEPADVLMVGEGIETCLAVMQATGLPAWAALSTSGLKSLQLPKAVLDVVVLADGDEAGEAAALSCAKQWVKQGRKVRIARPPKDLDFNDLLIDQTPTAGAER